MTPENIRLQKIISQKGIASRREAEKLIQNGSVQVNGVVITELGTRANPEKDEIIVDKTVLQKRQEQKIVLVLWKPVGVVTSTKSSLHEPDIIFDLLPKRFRHLFPVGRLDKDSSGFLILTNDGDLAFHLTHPKFHHTKTYHVLLQKPLSSEDVIKVREGDVRILGRRIRPAPIRKLGGSRIEILLTEGKNRHIRRLFRALGNGVKKLRRIGVGKLFLEDLHIEEGAWKVLSDTQIQKLLETGEEKYS